MKLIVKDKSWAHDVVDILRGRKDHPSKHEQLFGVLGSDGPALMLTAIKLVLLGSIVSIAVLFTVLFPLLWAINPFMPFFALFPSVVAIILIPRIVTLYTWVTSTEMLKVRLVHLLTLAPPCVRSPRGFNRVAVAPFCASGLNPKP